MILSVFISAPIPVITEQPDDQIIELYANNINISLCCKAAGYDLTYWWTKNSVKLTSHSQYNDYGNEFLCYTIENANLTDKGLYQCIVSNSAGNVSSRIVRISIFGMLLAECFY